MENSVWEDLKAYFEDDREDYIGGGVSLADIKIAEKELNVVFTDAYKHFLLKYGGATISGDLIYGLSYQQCMSVDCWSVIQNTNFYKHDQKWPDIDDWYIISDDGRGNPIGCKPDGSVWLSDHDAGFEQVKLADNFEEFLHKLLTDTLYE
jgi:hypothetical protein